MAAKQMVTSIKERIIPITVGAMMALLLAVGTASWKIATELTAIKLSTKHTNERLEAHLLAYPAGSIAIIKNDINSLQDDVSAIKETLSAWRLTD